MMNTDYTAPGPGADYQTRILQPGDTGDVLRRLEREIGHG